MTSLFKRRGLRGFTLIELLVVVAIILIIASLLLPVVAKARRMAKMTKTMNNGRGIFLSIFAEDLDRFARDRTENLYPNSTDYSDSTTYFTDMVADDVVETDFSFFAAPGVPAATGTTFSADNNAWSVTADLTAESPPDVPAMFTRNVDISELPTGGQSPSLDGDPFGGEGCVVVYMGGSAKRMLNSDLNQFNPSGFTNDVLRP